MSRVYTATRDFELTSGSSRWHHTFAYGEVRYEFEVKPRPGLSAAERPFVSVKSIEVKQGRYGKWMPADGLLADYLGDVHDAWFIEQLAEAEE